jgi:hypothetical protein
MPPELSKNCFYTDSQLTLAGYLSLFNPDLDFMAVKTKKIMNIKNESLSLDCLLALTFVSFLTSRFSQIILSGSGAYLNLNTSPKILTFLLLKDNSWQPSFIASKPVYFVKVTNALTGIAIFSIF